MAERYTNPVLDNVSVTIREVLKDNEGAGPRSLASIGREIQAKMENLPGLESAEIKVTSDATAYSTSAALHITIEEPLDDHLRALTYSGSLWFHRGSDFQTSTWEAYIPEEGAALYWNRFYRLYEKVMIETLVPTDTILSIETEEVIGYDNTTSNG